MMFRRYGQRMVFMSRSRASKTKGFGLMIGQTKEYKPYKLPNQLIDTDTKKPNRALRRAMKHGG